MAFSSCSEGGLHCRWACSGGLRLGWLLRRNENTVREAEHIIQDYFTLLTTQQTVFCEQYTENCKWKKKSHMASLFVSAVHSVGRFVLQIWLHCPIKQLVYLVLSVTQWHHDSFSLLLAIFSSGAISSSTFCSCSAI